MRAGTGSGKMTGALLEAARAVHTAGSLEEALDTIVASATSTLPTFDHVGISRTRGDGTIETMSASDDLVLELDALQYQNGEGPCVESVRVRPRVKVEHAERDPRWPRFLPEAVRKGLRSQLALRLSSDQGTLGGLNLYSTASDTIDPDAYELAELFAVHAAIALDRRRETEQLKDALSSRKTIGEAIGLTMARYEIDEDRAFEYLSRASQTSNIKLRQIAEEVVELANARFGTGSE